MDLLQNSARVLAVSGDVAALVLFAVLWGSLLAFTLLSRDPSRPGAQTAALALGGWPLPLLLMSALSLLLRCILPLWAVGVIVIGLAALSAVFSFLRLRGRVKWTAVIPILIFLPWAYLRLGYAADIVLPPYFDSAFHYSLIRSILDAAQGAPLSLPVDGWYHPGYHILAAGLSLPWAAWDDGPARLMIILGQFILAAMPFPLYAWVRSAGGSRAAGWLAAALAGLAWDMPAHAVDWGKYPALLGLLTVEFTVGAALRRDLRIGAGASLAAAFIHTRAAVVLAAAGLVRWLSRLTARRVAALAVLLAAADLFFALTDPAFAAAFKRYLVWGSLALPLLAALAWRKNARASGVALLAAAGLPLAMLVPLPGGLVLLDRPFVEMALFLPLAFLGGLGMDGLPKSAAAAVAAFILLASPGTAGFHPSDCCQLAGRNDLAALHSLESLLPTESLIGIAGTDLQVSAAGEPLRGAGVDGGVWVVPLTGRAVRVLPASTDFGRPETLEHLCAGGLTHLYAGGRPLSFNVPAVDGYRPIFSLTGAVIYELGCPP